ncbi:MAG: UDP-N-acetylmuramoyl-tripeptide--D-alanyl-D-alanine ligase [Bacteroidota bacterium]
MLIKELYQIFLKHPQVSTDTRKIIKDSIYFAIKGKNFDGNLFASSALENGAAFAVIDNEKYYIDNGKYILVKDTLATLQQLALNHRQNLNILIIGITGTNGKTTTKELINVVLSEKYNTLATIGNLNNHIGVPLTILGITKDTEIAIIEMGANHVGEIGELCKISQPDYGIITNIGKAHLEGFGSFEGVIKAKNDLYIHIKDKKGKIFINSNNELLMNLSKDIDKITYGTSDTDFCCGEIISANPNVEISYRYNDLDFNFKTNLVGSYNFENIMAAICVGIYFNVDHHLLKKALETYVPTNNRSQVVKTEHNTLILDAYNANPTSMEQAISNFAKMDTNNKVLIIGDMLELGSYSLDEHQSILNLIEKDNFQNVILVGKDFKTVNKNFLSFTTSDEAREWLKNNPIINSTILIKGSRGIKLEKIIDAI